MITVERSLHREIMATDIYIAISSAKYTQEEIEGDIEEAVSQLKKFEHRFSRFNNESELSQFNNSSTFKASQEFIDLLKVSLEYYLKTEKLFNPALLPILLQEGYTHSFYSKNQKSDQDLNTLEYSYNFEEIRINTQTNLISKPINMKIDFGGIGKGYMVNKLSEFLQNKYKDYCIDLGGDMFLGGEDRQNNYPYWAIEIENPLSVDLEMPTLILRDMAVATSGVNRRNWRRGNITRNHIINEKEGSLNNDLLCVTVLSDDCIKCDIFAKVLLILGLKAGVEYSEEHNLPAIFVGKDNSLVINKNAQKYVWTE